MLFSQIFVEIEVDGLHVNEAYFRGRKLQGTTISLPQGYSGKYPSGLPQFLQILFIPYVLCSSTFYLCQYNIIRKQYIVYTTIRTLYWKSILQGFT